MANGNGRTPKPVRSVGIEHVDRAQRLIIFVGPPSIERKVNGLGFGTVDPDFKHNNYRLTVDPRFEVVDVVDWLLEQRNEEGV